jgi:hypothetical protein
LGAKYIVLSVVKANPWRTSVSALARLALGRLLVKMSFGGHRDAFSTSPSATMRNRKHSRKTPTRIRTPQHATDLCQRVTDRVLAALVHGGNLRNRLSGKPLDQNVSAQPSYRGALLRSFAESGG